MQILFSMSDKIDWTTIENVVIETGANARRTYYFQNGLMVCHRVYSDTVNINTSWDSFYKASWPSSDVNMFPVNGTRFIEAPTINATLTLGGTTSAWLMANDGTISSDGIIPAGVFGIVRGSSRTNVAIKMNLTAIGRWK